jgi:hypothetical protein
MSFPSVVPNATNADGRCGHNMIPRYCALCNPIKLSPKKRKRMDRRKTTSRFILILVDCEDGQELERFWDDEVTKAKRTRDEVNETCGEGSCRIDIIDNPNHPDYEPPDTDEDGDNDDATV